MRAALCGKFQLACEIPRNSKQLLTFSQQNLQLNTEGLSGTGRAQTVGEIWGELMKILLAIDGSRCSDAAVEEVARRPWPERSTVKVLSAFEVPAPPTPEAWALPGNYFEEMDIALRKQARSIVDRALETLKPRLNKTVALDAALVPGPARVVILDEAESWDADLIVVGSHGYRAWERFLLGSVSQSVVSHAKCSVEVVRCPRADEAAEKKA